MVYYLKYRPKTLSELLGQDHIVQTLQKSLEQNKLSHAYIFSGPKGVGKTSTARILAKMVNCPKLGCNNCEICESINNGSSLDLIEIDAASNRGIDDIRELRDKIKLSPSSLKKKVYIIDEVHMLTTEAFNALLKTLEEPPEHALFILATTDIQKVPQTILSRVTRLDFKEANAENLTKALQKIAKEEKLELEEDALNLLVKKSEGSFRDGIKLLDQLSSVSNKITKKLVEEALNLSKFEAVAEMLNLISEDKSKEAIILANKQIKEGSTVKDLIYTFLEICRALILIKYQVIDIVSGEYSEENLRSIKNLSEKFSKEDLLKILDNFQKAYANLKFAGLPILPLEIAIMESSAPVILKAQPEGSLANDKKENDVAAAPPSSGNPTSPDMLTIKDKWGYILEMIKPYNFSLEALLRQVKIHSVIEGQVVLAVPYSFHQRILETPRNRDLLESVLTDVLGRQTRVDCVLEAHPVRVEELSNVEVAADDEVIKIAAEIFNS